MDVTSPKAVWTNKFISTCKHEKFTSSDTDLIWPLICKPHGHMFSRSKPTNLSDKRTSNGFYFQYQIPGVPMFHLLTNGAANWFLLLSHSMIPVSIIKKWWWEQHIREGNEKEKESPYFCGVFMKLIKTMFDS